MVACMTETQYTMPSFVLDHGDYYSSCGYCGRDDDSSLAYGMTAIHLETKDYQQLIDRGWRRSGKFLYKPNLEASCCPPYTIRLDVKKFTPSKEQRRSLRKFEQYLNGTSTGTSTSDKNNNCSSSSNSRISPPKENASSREKSANVHAKKDSSKPDGKTNDRSTSLQEIEYYQSVLNESISKAKRKRKLPDIDFDAPMVKERKPSSKSKTNKRNIDDDKYQLCSPCAYSMAAKCKKSKLECSLDAQKITKILVETIHEDRLLPKEKVVADGAYINFSMRGRERSVEPPPCQASSSSTTMNRPENNERKANDPTKKQFSIETIRAHYSEESFQLYRKYQMNIHKEANPSPRSYLRFLVDSPLYSEDDIDDENDETTEPQEDRSDSDGEYTCINLEEIAKRNCHIPCGSYHQLYRIDDKLVAVGVVDILPNCLSAKYFYYDPDYKFLELGKISALKEIEWIQKASAIVPDLHFYYMGYYIHSCEKMRYKAKYKPSDLLCPYSLKWVTASSCLNFFEEATVPRLYNPEPEIATNVDKEEREAEDLSSAVVNVLDGNQMIRDRVCSSMFEKWRTGLIEYVSRVGRELASRMVYIDSRTME